MKDLQKSLNLFGLLVVIVTTVVCDLMQVQIRVLHTGGKYLNSVIYNSDVSGMTKLPESDDIFYHSYAVGFESSWKPEMVFTVEGTVSPNVKFASKGWEVSEGGKIESVFNTGDSYLNLNALVDTPFQSISANILKDELAKLNQSNSLIGGPSKKYVLCWSLKVEFKNDLRIVYSYPQIEFQEAPGKDTIVTIHYIAVKKESPLLVLLWSLGVKTTSDLKFFKKTSKHRPLPMKFWLFRMILITKQSP